MGSAADMVLQSGAGWSWLDVPARCLSVGWNRFWLGQQPAAVCGGPKIPKGYRNCPCLTNKYSSASSLTAPPPQIMAHQPNHPSPASRTPWTLLLSKPNGDEQDAPRQGMSNGSHEAGDELSTKKKTQLASPRPFNQKDKHGLSFWRMVCTRSCSRLFRLVLGPYLRSLRWCWG